MVVTDCTTEVCRCRDCGVQKPRSEFYNSRGRSGQGFRPMCRCIPCYNRRTAEQHRRRYTTDPGYRAQLRATSRRAMIRRNYGIGEDRFLEMLADQGGVCAICFQRERVRTSIVGLDGPRPKELAVDHNHRTGRVRGLLCTVCNQFVGKLEKSPEVTDRALAYIERDRWGWLDETEPEGASGGKAENQTEGGGTEVVPKEAFEAALALITTGLRLCRAS